MDKLNNIEGNPIFTEMKLALGVSINAFRKLGETLHLTVFQDTEELKEILDMKKMTTDNIFDQIISKRAWYLELGIPEGTANSYASRHRSGKLSIEKKEEILIKAGYSVKQEKLWQKK